MPIKNTGKCYQCGQLSLIPKHLGLRNIPKIGYFCEDCYKDLTEPCHECGKRYLKSRMSKMPSNSHNTDTKDPHVWLCPNCLPQIDHCKHCGTILNWHKERFLTDGNNVIYCSDCKQEFTTKCDYCEGSTSDSNIRHVHTASGRDKVACSICDDRNMAIFTCQICHERYETSLMSNQFSDVCTKCEPTVRRCSECGSVLPISEFPSEDPSSTSCNRCESRRYQIREHDYAPSELVFHGLEHSTSPRESLYCGFELEVDTTKSSVAARKSILAAQICKQVGLDHVFCKHDGSLHAGFEMVTQPATLEYMLFNREKYELLCKLPKEAGYQSHDVGTCGLHVHADRRFLDPNRSENISKIIWLVEKFWPEIFKFSRRKGADIGNWAARYLGPTAARDISKVKKNSLLTTAEQSGRYHAINIQKSSTVEFRMFRGTLNEQSFWATLQLVNNMVSFAKSNPEEVINNCSWDDIINFKFYPELSDYNDKRVNKSVPGPGNRVAVPDITDSGWRDIMEHLIVPQMPTPQKLGTVGLVVVKTTETKYEMLKEIRLRLEMTGCWLKDQSTYLQAREEGLLATDQFFIENWAFLPDSDLPGGVRTMVVARDLQHRFRRVELINPVIIIPLQLMPSEVVKTLLVEQFEVLES